MRVLNMPFVDPLDERRGARRRARDARRSSPPRRRPSAAGSAPRSASVVVEHQPVPMRILGVRGEFAPTGSAAFLLEHFGLTADGIADAVRAACCAMSA